MESFFGFIFLIVVVFVFLHIAKRRRRRLLLSLNILQYELKRLLVEGNIDQERYDELLRKTHVELLSLMEEHGYRRNSFKWRELLTNAWRHLRTEQHESGPAPWERHKQRPMDNPFEEEPQDDIGFASSKQAVDPAPVKQDAGIREPASPPVAAKELMGEKQAIKLDSPSAEKTPGKPVEAPPSRQAQVKPPPQRQAQVKPPQQREKHREFALKPKEPSALEQWLKKTAQVPALMAPFLMQNIGWFVGGFLFLAGTIFLVLYTTGFIKAFVVFLALSAYSVFLLWAAYQLRKKRPELTISSRVLAILAVMLIPLTLAADVRLIDASSGSIPLILFSLALGLSGMLLFWIYANVVSGVIHSGLKGGHPKLYLMLSSVQLASVPINIFPSVFLLAFFQLSILALLAISVRSYAQEWLKSIFDDHEHISYYAMGTLLYAALVSFVHLNLSEVEVGSAYYGPFIMSVALLAAYIDVQFKQWRHKYVALSRFNFVVYGLSALALALSFQADWALSICLVLGMLIFAWMAYQHLSTPPLVVFLSMACWLYYVNILKLFSYDLYLLLALPGLAILFWTSHWLGGKKVKLSYHLYLINGALMYILLAVSTANGMANWLNFSSCLIVVAISYYLLRRFPYWDTQSATLTVKDQKDSHWYYIVLGLSALSLVFLPPVSGYVLSEQWVVLLFLHGAACGLYALTLWRKQPPHHTQIETLINTSVILLAVNLAIASGNHVDNLIFAAAGGGILLMVLALGLFSRLFLYLAMLLILVAVYIFRLQYLPGPRSGLGPVLLGLSSYTLLWWLERKARQPSDAKSRQTIYLLGVYKVKGPQ